ncbi:Dabb family protein [Prosthecobacter sp. SYSU 5D2]|uniref:Dabb family protein n=1 Tax=Prosthecobacter sp. SYSU 5D2 TaxID=3134134 RepID=UPI0031FEE75D
MIEHTVTFLLKHASGSVEEQRFLQAAAALASLPGVRDFAIRRQTSAKNPHAFGITMRFDSQAAYDGYSQHPEHVAFVQERWLAEVEDFLEADFEPLEGGTLS